MTLRCRICGVVVYGYCTHCNVPYCMRDYQRHRQRRWIWLWWAQFVLKGDLFYYLWRRLR